MNSLDFVSEGLKKNLVRFFSQRQIKAKRTPFRETIRYDSESPYWEAARIVAGNRFRRGLFRIVAQR
jgi:hypothetical protein